MQILRIDSATTGDSSVSRVLTQAALDHFRSKHPEARIVDRDYGKAPLPHLDDARTGAIRLPQDQHTDAMKAVFPEERAVLDEFLASDIVVIGAPMYNFTVPSQINAWMDRLGVPGVTFKYSEAGPEGLAGGRKVIVLSTRGGEYQQDGAFEHQETLMRDFFAFIGITDPVFIRAEKIGFGPEAREEAINSAKAEIASL
ncbi:FMN-dependent NADH-azoreductase [Altererythrobacter atlanticus]|uniref:FMN dependent NADH:quinone oxidoreductase n=1 Tax=Croceibacterium atlanticum TaxID=1267766 RepID=A0A0F7KKW1_9SPHN|nr:NAD(P)H-dependent oxidoreductase [Croceibacterium atlanticum]AKH41208.1 FMN-dependent NADH-azoreductase 1 [Croceibacterium atlanticum]MBB5732726.1 FMN-dependent NADH-azoreductase [Croceibacterium atlanticum]